MFDDVLDSIKDKYEVQVDSDGRYFVEISEGDWEYIWESIRGLEEELSDWIESY